jgi:hypothetical protein
VTDSLFGLSLTGQTQMLEAPKIDAMSLIALLVAIEAGWGVSEAKP